MAKKIRKEDENTIKKPKQKSILERTLSRRIMTDNDGNVYVGKLIKSSGRKLVHKIRKKFNKTSERKSNER